MAHAEKKKTAGTSQNTTKALDPEEAEELNVAVGNIGSESNKWLKTKDRNQDEHEFLSTTQRSPTCNSS